jgi:predicted NBD/HSP70 family sugar kinase
MATAVETLLTLLLSGQTFTRAELAERAAVSRTYVTQVTDALLREGLLTEVSVDWHRTGRAPKAFSWREDSWRYALVSLRRETLTVAWYHPALGVLSSSAQMVAHQGGASVTDAIFQGIDDLVTGMPQQALRGIAVAVPGVVDRARGVVLQAVNLNMRDVLLKRSLEARYHLPVIVERAPCAAALLESVRRQQRELFYVETGDGVGGAAIHQGQIVPGGHHAAGEIGHLVVNPGGAVCRCGKRGCLETVISEPALRAHNPVAHDVVEGRSSPWLTESALADVIHWLGMALNHVIALLDPEIIVLGPHLQGLHSTLLARMDAEVNQATVPERHVPVLPSSNATPILSGLGVLLTIADLTKRVTADMDPTG